MTDTDPTPRLNLDDEFPLDLSDSNYQLILKYKSKTHNSPASNGRIGWEGAGSGVSKGISDISNELIAILKKIKGMDKYKTRTYLLRGFSQSQLEGIDRHPESIQIDLSYIVDHIVYLEKLPKLIDNVKALNINETCKSNLEQILADYDDFISKSKRKSKSEADNFPPRNKI